MSELMLTLLRLGFLAVLWALVIITVLVLRRDLRAPRDSSSACVRRSITALGTFIDTIVRKDTEKSKAGATLIGYCVRILHYYVQKSS